jgi:membrane fusion protein (multidrug efflux system)
MARIDTRRAGRRAAGLLLGLGVAALAGCGGKGQAAEEGKEKDVLNGVTKSEQVNVVVEALAPRPFVSRLELVGEIQSENDATLSAQAGGVVERIVADRGRQVRRGDTLLVLDSRRYRAGFEAAQAQCENTRLDFQMADRLYKNGQGISENDWKKAQNGLRMAEAALANARIDLENCFVTAPVGGVVAERFVDLGELVGPGAPLVQLVQGELKARCGLPEGQAGRVRTGQSARVRVTDAGVDVPARIDWVGAVLDGRSRTVPAELGLARNASLKPGMACQVEIERGGEGSLVIPVTVVQTAPDHAFVFVEEQGKAARRVVTLGQRSGDQVEALSGLAAGDRLIVSGYRGLAEGQAVAVVDVAAGQGRAATGKAGR